MPQGLYQYIPPRTQKVLTDMLVLTCWVGEWVAHAVRDAPPGTAAPANDRHGRRCQKAVCFFFVCLRGGFWHWSHARTFRQCR